VLGLGEGFGPAFLFASFSLAGKEKEGGENGEGETRVCFMQ